MRRAPLARKRPPQREVPRYNAADWAPLVNACRQPRSAYRWALLVPGAESLAGLPAAGEAGRWFLLPPGALLLRREPGGLEGMQDLRARPLDLGPFLLRQVVPVRPDTAARREALRQVRAARRELRGTPVPAPPAIPNEGRALRFGPRLALTVSAQLVRSRIRAATAAGLRATYGEPQRLRPGQRAPRRQAKPTAIRTFDPEYLAHALNQMTAELEAVAEFAWVEVGTLRRWDSAARQVMTEAMTRTGTKPALAKHWAAQHVRPWQRSRPSQATRRTARTAPDTSRR
ncbi:hypothetical protein K5D85_15680 [Deinococcus sp. RIT780]|nr:hypothetical protein [Deinococcus sp. RIT780]